MSGLLAPDGPLPHLGQVLLGLLLGELLHRLILLLEELPHLQERYKGSRLALLQDVFSNCHQQLLSGPVLLLLGLALVLGPLLLQPSSPGGPALLEELPRSLLTVAFIYTLLRSYGALDNSLEDLQVLEEKNALLGPGLATNYWFSFLKWILVPVEVTNAMNNTYGDLKDVMGEVKASTEPRDKSDDEEIDEDGAQIGRLREAGGSKFRAFMKMIILLPSDCKLNIRKQKELREENIFVLCTEDVAPLADQCECEGSCRCKHENCLHDFHFKVERVQRRPPIKITVHWIYEREEDERTRNPAAKKILVMFDFPMLLQSAMGPGRDMANNPGMRARNVETFQATLTSFLSSNDYLKFRDSVAFQPFSVEEAEGGAKIPLSARIRETIRRDELNQ